MPDLNDELKDISGKKALKIIATFGLLLFCGFFLLKGCFFGSSPRVNNGHFVIGRDPTWYPVNLLGKDALMVGFTNELIVEIARRENVALQIQNVGSEVLFQGLNEGRYDGVINSLTPTSLNQEVYQFSTPFYLLGPVVIVRRDSPLESLEQLQGKYIGVQSGSVFANRSKNFPSFIFSYYQNMRVAIDDLVSGKLDAVVMDVLPAYAYLRGQNGEYLKLLGRPLTIDGLRVVVKQNERGTALLDLFDKGLEVLIKDGTYRKLLTKWDLVETITLPAEDVGPSVITSTISVKQPR